MLSCVQPLDEPEAAVPSSGATGLVIVTASLGGDASGEAARTILPTTPPAFSRYKLVFSKAGSLDVEIDPADLAGDKEESRELAAGTWTAEVTAYRAFAVTGASESEYAAAKGSADLTISVGQTTPVTVQIRPIPVTDTTDKGIFTYTVTFPEDASCTLKFGDKVAVPESGKTVSLAVAPGYYDLTVSLVKEGSGSSAGLREMVHIYSGLVSEANFVFEDADFDIPPEKLKRYIVKPVDTGRTLQYSFNDGETDYYYFYLGKVEEVPIWTGPAIKINGFGDIRFGFSEAVSTEKGYRNSLAHTISKTTSTTHTYGAGFNVDLHIQKVASVGFSHTWSKGISEEYTESRTNTYTTYVQEIKKQSAEMHFSVNREDALGFHRPVVLTTHDVYMVVTKNNKFPDKITGAYETFPRTNYLLRLDYSKDGNFLEEDVSTPLTFDPDWINDAPPSSDFPMEWQKETPGNGKIINVGNTIEVLYIKGSEDPPVMYTDMQIVLEPGRPVDRDLMIFMDSVRFTGPAGKPAIDASLFMGKIILMARKYYNEIRGADGADYDWFNRSTFEETGSGQPAITCASLEIRSYYDKQDRITLYGGNSADYFGGQGLWGLAGGNAINATTEVIIYDDALVDINGGDGGNGDNASGAPFLEGGSGGDGGHGIFCSGKVALNSNASGVIWGGDGGNGAGGYTYPMGDYSPIYPNGDGGNGGNGVVSNDYTNISEIDLYGGLKGTTFPNNKGANDKNEDGVPYKKPPRALPSY
jgi:hypothetical protein